uniref:Uncharacterized protein n=1 Tax=Oryza glaberrima TaxID=4538 RepID=I1PYS7_ORYGL
MRATCRSHFPSSLLPSTHASSLSLPLREAEAHRAEEARPRRRRRREEALPYLCCADVGGSWGMQSREKGSWGSRSATRCLAGVQSYRIRESGR